MNIARLHTILTLTLYAILTACGGGSSPTTAGSQSVSSYQRGTTAQIVSGAVPPGGSGCSQLDQQHKLKSTEVVIRFPEDCGVTGEIRVPVVRPIFGTPS